MKKDFVEYPEALALKELGFDEPCIAWFAETKDLQIAPETYKKWTSKPCNNSNIVKVFNNDCFTAPTFSAAFRWFREKYGYCSYIKEAIVDDYRFYIEKFDEKYYNSSIFKSYEEAELACLKKLIEIVKQK